MVKHFEDRVARLKSLVDGWRERNEIPHIERDLALDELRKLYDALLSVECGVSLEQPKAEEPKAQKAKVVVPVVESNIEPTPEIEPVVVEMSPKRPAVDPLADFDDALDIDALLGIKAEEAAAAAEPEVVVVSQPEPTPEPAPQPQPNTGGGLFAIEDIPVRSKSGRKMISLYDSSASSVITTPQPEPAPAPTPAPQPVAMPEPTPRVEPQVVVSVAESAAPQRLGDVLGSGRKVVGDMQSVDNAPIAPMNKIADLRKAIGLNDKFLLLRDLFNGDVPLYERTIDALNSFEDLDECMIYIVENFRWNPDSEGAKMLVSLIERKLS